MRIALLAAGALLFAASAHAETITPYQPAAASRSHAGFSETQIDVNRVRVAFAGKSGTSREAVETNLLYRAAETTLARGYDYFVVLEHNVETAMEFENSGPPGPLAPRRYRETARYQAVSDIVMRRGPRPIEAANAYDARTVQANLAAHIARPR
jgi:hypothetical protein